MDEAEAVFDRLKAAVDRACAEKDFSLATSAAKAEGLDERDVSRGMSLRLEYRRDFDGAALLLEVRSYDQSQAFSLQPDMNRLALTLTRGEERTRSHGNHYED